MILYRKTVGHLSQILKSDGTVGNLIKMGVANFQLIENLS
jgi:hypothetical protein